MFLSANDPLSWLKIVVYVGSIASFLTAICTIIIKWEFLRKKWKETSEANRNFFWLLILSGSLAATLWFYPGKDRIWNSQKEMEAKVDSLKKENESLRILYNGSISDSLQSDSVARQLECDIRELKSTRDSLDKQLNTAKQGLNKKITERDTVIKKKDVEINTLTSTNIKLDKEREELKHKVHNLEMIIKEKNGKILMKDAEIAKLNDRISELEKCVNARYTIVLFYNRTKREALQTVFRELKNHLFNLDPIPIDAVDESSCYYYAEEALDKARFAVSIINTNYSVENAAALTPQRTNKPDDQYIIRITIR